MDKLFTQQDIHEFFMKRGYNPKFFDFLFEDSGDAVIVNVNERYYIPRSRRYLFTDFSVEEEGRYQVFQKEKRISEDWVRFLCEVKGEGYKKAFISNMLSIVEKEILP